MKIKTQRICAGNYQIMVNGSEAGTLYHAVEDGGYWYLRVDYENLFIEDSFGTKAEAMYSLDFAASVARGQK